MNGLCPHCEKNLAHEWSFCPHCGAEIPHPVQPASEHPGHEPAPVKGAFGGMFFGFVAVPLLLIVGSMLCLTGLGAFLGVPMIIAGILAPLGGTLFGLSAEKSKAKAH